MLRYTNFQDALISSSNPDARTEVLTKQKHSRTKENVKVRLPSGDEPVSGGWSGLGSRVAAFKSGVHWVWLFAK